MKIFVIVILIHLTTNISGQCNINNMYYFNDAAIGRGFKEPNLNKGTKFKITATGSYTFAFANYGTWNATPDGGTCQGEGNGSLMINEFLYPALPCWALLGQIGDGEVFVVGSKYEGIAEESGALKLFVNCSTRFGYANTQGGWNVELKSADEQDCPSLFAGYDMAKTVDSNNGHVPYNFEECIAKNTSTGNGAIAGGLYFQKTTPMGHEYLAINPLGTYNISLSDIVNMLNFHIGQIFPGGAVDYTIPGSTVKNTTIVKDHEYSLVANKWWNPFFYPRVICTNVSAFHFTFVATTHHLLQGTAIHGIFQDRCGKFYIFQQGYGQEDETKAKQSINKHGAYLMWLAMAENMREWLSNGKISETVF